MSRDIPPPKGSRNQKVDPCSQPFGAILRCSSAHHVKRHHDSILLYQNRFVRLHFSVLVCPNLEFQLGNHGSLCDSRPTSISDYPDGQTVRHVPRPGGRDYKSLGYFRPFRQRRSVWQLPRIPRAVGGVAWLAALCRQIEHHFPIKTNSFFP
jgi:hypothetical protein